MKPAARAATTYRLQNGSLPVLSIKALTPNPWPNDTAAPCMRVAWANKPRYYRDVVGSRTSQAAG